MDSPSLEDSPSTTIVDGEAFYTPMSTQKGGGAPPPPSRRKESLHPADSKGPLSVSREREHAGFLSEGTMSYLGSIAKTKKDKSVQDADRESDKRAIDEILRRYDEEVFASGGVPHHPGSTPPTVPSSTPREGTSVGGIPAPTATTTGSDVERKETERIVKEWEKIHKEWSESKSRLASPGGKGRLRSLQSPSDRPEEDESSGYDGRESGADEKPANPPSLVPHEEYLVEDEEEPTISMRHGSHSPREQTSIRKEGIDSDEEEVVVVQDDEMDEDMMEREEDVDAWKEGDELVDLLVNRPRKKSPDDLCSFSSELLSILDSIGMDGEEDSLERFRSQLRSILSQRERICML
jgi:hypothetical protein